MKQRWTIFVLMTVVLWLLAHSVALFCHEFSHSFVASAFGWKHNPIALNWGSPSLMNLLCQVDIDENVNYQPIFLNGHPHQAAVIALAGMGLGNAIISLSIGLGVFAVTRKRSQTVLGCFAYWLTLMSIGNLVSYVPLRVFTSHADMHTVAIGFGWTPRQLLAFLGIPILAGVLWFFFRFQPRALVSLFPDSPARRSTLIILSSVTFFGWFAMAGMSGYGDLSRKLSIAFIVGLMPLSIFLALVLTRRQRITTA
jgi:hypothetical protein